MNLPKNKFENVQALRGLAAMLVVFCHLFVIERKYCSGPSLLPTFLCLGGSGVDIFFVISGFIITTVISGNFQQPDGVKIFLVQRFTRIYPLYWFYSLLALLVFLLHPAWVNQSQHHQVAILPSLLLLPQSKLPLLEVGWTLIHEMYFYLVIAACLFFSEKKFIALLLGWAMLIMVATSFTFHSSSLLLITHPLTIEFISGCFLALLLQHMKPRNSVLLFIIALILFAIVIGAYSILFPGQLPTGWSRVALFGLPSMLLVYAAVGLEINNLVLPHFTRTLGDASYSIYLSHILVLSAIGRILMLLPWHTIYLFHLVELAILFIAVVSCGLLSYYFLEKPLIIYFRKSTATKWTLLSRAKDLPSNNEI